MMPRGLMATTKKWGLSAKLYFQKNRRRAWISTGVIVGVAAVTIVLAQLQNQIEDRKTELEKKAAGLRNRVKSLESSLTKPAPSSSAPKGPPSLAYAFKAGDILQYHLESFSEIQMSPPAMPEGGVRGVETQTKPSRFIWQLTGGVDWAVYEADTQITIGWRFKNLAVHLDAGGQTPPAQALQAIHDEFNQEILVTLSTLGEVGEIFFPEKMTAGARNIIRALILKSHLILPRTPTETWTTKESDTTGRYDAEYAVEGGLQLENRTVARITRRKIHYTSRTVQSRGSEAAPEAATDSLVTDGETSAIFDIEGGYFQSIRSDDKIQQKVSGAYFGVQSSSEHSLLLQTRTRDDALRTGGSTLAAEWRKRGGGADFTREMAADLDRAMLTLQVGDSSFESTLADFAGCYAQDPADTSRSWHVWSRMVAHLRLSEENVEAALKALMAASTAPETRGALIDALAQLATPRAQKSLLKALEAASEADVKEAILQGLSRAPVPTPETIKAISTAAGGTPEDPVTASALLAMGTVAGTVSAADPARAREFVSSLQKIGSRSPDPGWKVTWLAALGNAGLKQAIGDIHPFLKDTDPVLRAAAAQSLRNIDSPKADEMLGQVLMTDEDSAVRYAAVRALSERSTPEARKWMERTLQNPKADEALRGAALTFYARRPSDDRDATDRITAVAATDSSESLKSEAQEILKERTKTP